MTPLMTTSRPEEPTQAQLKSAAGTFAMLSAPVRLHLVWEGMSQQDLAGPRSLVDRLTTRRYDGLRITHETIVGTHCAMVPFAYQSGLEKVFSN